MPKNTRREFLKSSAAALCAAGVPSSALAERGSPPPAPAGLSIDKGLVMSMLPEKLSVADRFKLARDAGFSVVQAPTTPDARQAGEGFILRATRRCFTRPTYGCAPRFEC